MLETLFKEDIERLEKMALGLVKGISAGRQIEGWRKRNERLSFFDKQNRDTTLN